MSSAIALCTSTISSTTEPEDGYADTTARMLADTEARPSDELSASHLDTFPILEARCATYPVDGDWIPAYETPLVPDQMLALCRTCPGRQNCLMQALLGEEAGYWAGTSSQDRAQMRTLGVRDIMSAERIQQATRTSHQVGEPATHQPGQGSDYRYRHGCHCLECRQAHRSARATERAAARAKAAARATTQVA